MIIDELITDIETVLEQHDLYVTGIKTSANADSTTLYLDDYRGFVGSLTFHWSRESS